MSQSVLIETYWNVKIFVSTETIFEENVLIETYWNVKPVPDRECARSSESINRNILECKEGETDNSVVPALVLIETYWNVKLCFFNMYRAT